MKPDLWILYRQMLRSRLFEEVVDHVMSSFVDPVDRGDIYQSAIDGLLRDLGDPNTSFIRSSALVVMTTCFASSR